MTDAGIHEIPKFLPARPAAGTGPRHPSPDRRSGDGSPPPSLGPVEGGAAVFAYETACRAIAAARRVDQVKDIGDKAEALRVYARQAKNRDLEIDAAEIRIRAERRLGQLLAAADLHKGGRPAAEKTGADGEPVLPPKLADLGVDRKLSARAQQLAAVPDTQFAAELERWRNAAEKDGARVTARLARGLTKSQARAEREKALAQKIAALPERKYGLIYADPEWRFETRSQAGQDRAAANHYPVSALADLAARPVGDLAAEDCILFLWATVPMLVEAICVMDAWGFAVLARDRETGFLMPDRTEARYVSHWAWIKDRAGTGYWGRNNHELLLIATRGRPVAPAPGTQPLSALGGPLGKHSAKPDFFRELIEECWPATPKIVLNHRGAPWAGWDCWGNEVDSEADSSRAEPGCSPVPDDEGHVGCSRHAGDGEGNRGTSGQVR